MSDYRWTRLGGFLYGVPRYRDPTTVPVARHVTPVELAAAFAPDDEGQTPGDDAPEPAGAEEPAA